MATILLIESDDTKLVIDPIELLDSGVSIFGDEGKREASSAAWKTRQLLVENPHIQTLTFSNNLVLYGQERGKDAELNENFWDVFLEILESFENIRVLELHVQSEDFTGLSMRQVGRTHFMTTENEKFRRRLLMIHEVLTYIGKSLHCLVSENYFGKAEVVAFMEQHKIEWEYASVETED
jgi:hypothetical protein